MTREEAIVQVEALIEEGEGAILFAEDIEALAMGADTLRFWEELSTQIDLSLRWQSEHCHECSSDFLLGEYNGIVATLNRLSSALQLGRAKNLRTYGEMMRGRILLRKITPPSETTK